MSAADATLGSGEIALRYSVRGFQERWLVSETNVPEAAWHEQVLAHLRDVLRFHMTSTGRDAAVFRNLAIRVRQERPNVGFDPDVCVVEPAPPGASTLDSLCLWRPGHSAPTLSVEVVSPGHPYKDYVDIPARCASAGVRELVVFDPKLAGPASVGGPHLLQLWRRSADGAFERLAAGASPAWSDVLGAWFVASDGALHVADDSDGAQRWPTELEQERRAAEQERRAKEQALRRVAELEAELARRG